jgi:hypothetical protein
VYVPWQVYIIRRLLKPSRGTDSYVFVFGSIHDWARDGTGFSEPGGAVWAGKASDFQAAGQGGESLLDECAGPPDNTFNAGKSSAEILSTRTPALNSIYMDIKSSIY